MRVAAQVQAEMTEIARPVLGLRLGAQHDLVQKLLMLGAHGFGQDAVELAGPVEARFGRIDADARQELAQRHQFLRRRRIVNPVDQRRLLRFKRFGGRDIRLDHEFFDEPVGFKPLRHDDARHEPAGRRV